jgi:2',3'-cyclic-nucleotide 2'-phosphodiesterase (5'-nucleotidase family)
MNEILGQLDHDLTLGRPESTLGNWLCDIIQLESEILTGTHIHLSIMNYGGIRLTELQEGSITMSDAFELLPFPNEVVVMHLSGEHLETFFEKMADQKGWPVSESVEYTIWNGKPFQIEIEDEEIHSDRTYNIATSDYVANGGDGFEFLRGLPRTATGVLIRDMFISYLRKTPVKHRAIITGRVNLYDE